MRIDLLRLFKHLERFLPVSLPPLNRRNQPADLGVVRRKVRGAIELFERTLVIFVDPVDALAECKVRFGQIQLQTQGGFRFLARFYLPGLERFVEVKNFGARRGEPGVRERKIRIERDRLHIDLRGRFVILQQSVGIACDLIGAQVKNVGVGILRRLRFNARFLLRAESGAERVGNFCCQFTLQA